MNKLPIVDEPSFIHDVVQAYALGHGYGAPVTEHDGRAVIPPATSRTRDLSYVGAEIPVFDAARCTACMECVNVCPDTALLGRVLPEGEARARVEAIADGPERAAVEGHLLRSKKFYEQPQKRGLEPALFGIFVDPARCKGCGECTDVCADSALVMKVKADDGVETSARATFAFAAAAPEAPAGYVQDRVPADWMLSARSMLYSGAVGSCRGCGEATTIRMMLAANGFTFGADSPAVVAATGCNSVFGATWPYNPYSVPWTNSLFENACAVSMGLRARYDQRGLADKKVWVVGGDGALCDIGFGSLSRLLASRLDVNVLVLDTQVYSNTGGQASTATFMSQVAKMASDGPDHHGKVESRKELGLLALMHGDVYVAQTTAAHLGHFFRSVVDAASYRGPSVVNVYCPCQPEHLIPDDATARQSKLAVAARAFPLFVYDPRKGATIKERLSLQGNPSVKEDWHKDPKTGEVVDFVSFARTEGRFARHFDADGNPSGPLLAAREERLRNWNRVRELAGRA